MFPVFHEISDFFTFMSCLTVYLLSFYDDDQKQKKTRVKMTNDQLSIACDDCEKHHIVVSKSHPKKMVKSSSTHRQKKREDFEIIESCCRVDNNNGTHHLKSKNITAWRSIEPSNIFYCFHFISPSIIIYLIKR